MGKVTDEPLKGRNSLVHWAHGGRTRTSPFIFNPVVLALIVSILAGWITS